MPEHPYNCDLSDENYDPQQEAEDAARYDAYADRWEEVSERIQQATESATTPCQP